MADRHPLVRHPWRVEPTARPLVLSHFSLRSATFPQRCAAAVAGGFAGIGLYVGAYHRLRAEGWTDARLAAVLADHGLGLLEVEALSLDRLDGLEAVAHLAGTFGARHVQVVPPFADRWPVGRLAEAVAVVAERVAPARVALEFLPFTGVPDAPTALAAVTAAGHPGAGLCVDAWHVFRGAGLASLGAVPAAAVASIQFDDGTLTRVPDDAYVADTLAHRLPPGEGEFDLTGFLAALPAEVPLGVEVPSDRLEALGDPVAVGRLLGAATRRVLSRA